MNRRNFLKTVGKTIGGVLGLGAVGLPKKLKEATETIPTPPPKLGDVYYSEKDKGYQKLNYFDFSLDEIVSFEKYEGSFFVICKHSVWEIF